MEPTVLATTVERPTITQHTLENGLQMVWEEDHRQPVVAIEALIQGGLRAEGPYLGTGITHFIEHMLFKGTPTRPAGTLEEEVRRYGGTINAFTSRDVTGITLFVEAQYLAQGLDLVADVLQHATFSPEEVEKERAVIISEIQMNLDNPQRRLQHLFMSRHYLEHPYRHPILGYQSLLEQLRVQDLQTLYANQYHPQNVVISCVGDLDGAAMPALAKHVFGGWARGRIDPHQLAIPYEPPTASAKRATIRLPVQNGYILLGFSSTRLADPELYPLDVLASILGRGRSSRLYETLVRQQRLAHDVDAWNDTPRDPGVFGISLRVDADKTESAIEAVVAIIEKIRREGVTEAELAKAKRQVTADYVFRLQTVQAKAGDLASSLAATGDPLFSSRYVIGIQGVTAAEVHDVAKRFCDPMRMTSAVILPEGEAIDTSTPVTVMPVAIERTVLDNGITVLTGVDSHLPIAGIVLGVRGGVRIETEASQGISNLVAQMLTKGTSKRGAVQINETVESLGASLNAFSGRDGFGLSLQVLAEDLEAGLVLMHELISTSTFQEEELAIQRELISKQLLAEEDEIFRVGGRLLRETFFEQHPYRFHPLGTRATIEALTRRDCQEFAQAWLVPSNMVVGVFGDIDRAAVLAIVEKRFGALQRGRANWPEKLPVRTPEMVREASRTMDKEQSVILFGFPGSRHTAEDRHVVDVMTTILSGMSGRLFQAIREEHGLSYALGAVHVPGWDPGMLLIYSATRPAEQDRVLSLLKQQVLLAASEGFTEEEVAQAQRYMIGTHRVGIQHVVGLVRRSVIDELHGLPYDAWTRYEQDVNAVTVAQVNEAAQRYLTMDRHAQVIVSPNGHARVTQ